MSEKKIPGINEKKYRWEACKRSGKFRKELIDLYNSFIERNQYQSNQITIKHFLKGPEIKILSQRYNIDSHSPFIDILKDNDNISPWEPIVIDSSVKLIRQESDNFPVKLAIKDNYMIIRIDIRKPRKQILLEIESLLTKYGLKSTKKPSYDLKDFEIYDLGKMGLSPWEITKTLYPWIDGKTFRKHLKDYDPEAAQLKKNIDDALKRAKSAVQSISQ
jgi:hypothetical protein